MTANSSQKLVARAAASAFGCPRPEVRRFYDEGESTAMDILACVDNPSPGYITYSSVNLHLARNLLDGSNVPVEMAGVAETSVSWFPNLLATAGFYLAKNSWPAAPGVVFPSLVKNYDPTTRLQHLLWATPFPWEHLSSVAIDSECAVHWLLAVPISESERSFLEVRGFDELESLFERENVEYFDLGRAPVV